MRVATIAGPLRAAPVAALAVLLLAVCYGAVLLQLAGLRVEMAATQALVRLTTRARPDLLKPAPGTAEEPAR